MTGIWLVDKSRSEDGATLLLSWTLFRFRLLTEALVPAGDETHALAAAAALPSPGNSTLTCVTSLAADFCERSACKAEK